MNQFGSNEAGRIQASSFAFGPAFHFPTLGIEGVAVEWRASRTQAESHIFALLVPFHCADYAERELQSRSNTASCCIEKVNHSGPVFISREGDAAAVRTDIEGVDVPLDIRCQVLRLQRGEIDVCQALELGIAIAGGVEAFSVFAESRLAISDLLGAFLGEQLLVA